MFDLYRIIPDTLLNGCYLNFFSKGDQDEVFPPLHRRQEGNRRKAPSRLVDKSQGLKAFNLWNHTEKPIIRSFIRINFPTQRHRLK